MSSTPILDLEQAPPAPRSAWRTILICLVIGAGIGIAPPAESLPAFNGLLWIPLLYIAIAIHELGHLAVGKMTGMAPGGLIVGGFVVMKSGDHWTFRFDVRRILGGGMAMPMPAKGNFETTRFAWMVAAGPIASVLSTLICWIAFRRFGNGTWDWIGSLFWASAAGLSSLIPMSAGVNKSDAARLWMLWRQPAQARAWMAAVSVQAENAKGVRPRDWDSALVEQMMSAMQPGSGQVFPQLMSYYRYLDEKNESAALEHLESALGSSAASGKAVQQVLFLEAAEATALLKDNAANSRVWLERALKLRKPESRSCTDGAVAMCEGRYDDALRDIAATRAFLLKRKLDSGLARFGHERLDERERMCREALLSSDRATASA